MFVVVSSALAQDASSNGGCVFHPITLSDNVEFGNVPVEIGGIDNAGAVVGAYGPPPGNSKSFLLYRGKLTPFEFPGSSNTFANAINNHSQIVGSYEGAGGLHGFVARNGKFEKLDMPGAQTWLTDINDKGDILGGFQNSQNVQGSFLLYDGHFATFNYPGTNPGSTIATGLNNHGVIVGAYTDPVYFRVHGFMAENGHFSTIDFPGASGTFVYRVNDEGAMAGYYFSAADGALDHGFIYAKGKFTKVDAPGGQQTILVGINDNSQVLGWEIVSYGKTRFFVDTCRELF